MTIMNGNCVMMTCENGFWLSIVFIIGSERTHIQC
jgi:hypothetical protein